MPTLIKHIDKISREKQCDVLMIRFTPDNPEDVSDYEHSKTRIAVIDWLSENEIEFEPCGEIANENSMLRYEGQLYVDVPFDVENSNYQKLVDYLENDDGTPRLHTVGLFYVPLSVSLRNAHHDEPGFWEDWAEHF